MDQMSFDALLAAPLVQLIFVGIAGIVVWHLIPRRLANTRLARPASSRAWAKAARSRR